MENISARNPDLEEMKEQGYAWVLRSTVTGKCGAPHTDEEFVSESPSIAQGTSELIIVDFEE